MKNLLYTVYVLYTVPILPFYSPSIISTVSALGVSKNRYLSYIRFKKGAFGDLPWICYKSFILLALLSDPAKLDKSLSFAKSTLPAYILLT